MRLVQLSFFIAVITSVVVDRTVSAHRWDIPGTTFAVRQLLQQQSSNCTAAHGVNDTKLPFCFQPSTISSEARQFLSQSASGQSAVDTSSPSGFQQLRASFRNMTAPQHAAAVQKYLDSTRNDSVGGVNVLVGTPKGVKAQPPASTKVLLFLHGGGYILGSCHHQLNTVAATAAAAGLIVMCPEYRLAPEHPFPDGLNDVLSVYKALITQQGYKSQNIVLLGDSAGGGLVAAAALQLQREGVALPAALGMFSPWTDAASKGDSMVTLNAVDPLLPGYDPQTSGSTPPLSGIAANYVGGNTSLFSDPLVSPVEVDYVSLFPRGSLPPTLIQVGVREVLLSDAIRLYHKMKAAAPAPGHVVISPYEGMWHVFQSYFNTPEAVAASKEMADYLSRALKGEVCK